jgi:hypothetical protein
VLEAHCWAHLPSLPSETQCVLSTPSGGSTMRWWAMQTLAALARHQAEIEGLDADGKAVGAQYHKALLVVEADRSLVLPQGREPYRRRWCCAIH